MRHGLRGAVLRHRLGLRGRRPRDRRRRADDRSTATPTPCVAGGTEAGDHRRWRSPPSPRMGATSRDRHLAALRPPPRRLRDGRGRRRCMVLEDAERAPSARRHRSSADLSGYGATSDAHHLTAPEPERRRRRAGDRSGAAPTPGSSLATSTTSTPTGPRRRSTTAPRPRRSSARSASARRSVPISSTKSAIGHLLGAAGAVEAVATLAGAARADRAADAQPTRSPTRASTSTTCPARRAPLDAQRRARRSAISNSFGFGGHNVVLCLEAAA